MDTLDNITASIMDIQSAFTKCGIYSTKWRRVAHIDMTDPTAHCPGSLRKISNARTNQRACRSHNNIICSSVTYHIEGNYTNVCGRVRGYQLGETEVFTAAPNINTTYTDGVLVTHGSPHKHLWTYIYSRYI